MSGTWLDSENNFKYVPTFKNEIGWRSILHCPKKLCLSTAVGNYILFYLYF